ncbi:MAG: hypothetical protein RMI91_13785 [Gemmatales bacterium]|nr:hypothetical protein [Gemmatales bacterium]MDW7995715.1 hypothetical protein [Gemmatales bacterium]
MLGSIDGQGEGHRQIVGLTRRCAEGSTIEIGQLLESGTVMHATPPLPQLFGQVREKCRFTARGREPTQSAIAAGKQSGPRPPLREPSQVFAQRQQHSMAMLIAFDQDRGTVIRPGQFGQIVREHGWLGATVEDGHFLTKVRVEHDCRGAVALRVPLGRVGSEDIIMPRLRQTINAELRPA